MPVFLDYYGLGEEPFGVTPDPAYFYLSRTHSEALDALSSGIKADRGFMALVAQPGMGKTTLLYHLLEQLRDSARSVFLFQTQCDSRELFRYILGELGVSTLGMDLVAMHSQLNKVLFSTMLEGKRFVLVVDEAQNLTEPVLETVRLLSNFETPQAKLLQIVLAGQPQLAEKLARPSLSQLRQRVAVVSRLEPLSVAETARYIDHRLKTAGYSGGPIFAPDALAMIAERSEGIPRKINHLCFGALALGCAQGRRTIGSETVRGVVAQLDVGSIARQADAAPVVAPPPTPQLAYKPAGPPNDRTGHRGAFVAKTLLLGALLFFVSARTFDQAPQRHAPDAAIERAIDPTLSDIPAIPTKSPSPGVDSVSKTTASGEASQGIAPLQFLTVVAGREETLREISLRYLGKFDRALFDQICALNPELKDPSHIEAGRLIRLPLPPGTLKKGLDTTTLDAVPKTPPTN